MAAAVHDKMYAEFLASVSVADRADIRSAGGSGAGLFLLPPEEESHVMPDAHLAAALRRRLRFPSAACRVAPTVPSHCNHRPRTGGICGAQLDALDFHAGTCECGGGVVQLSLIHI